MSDDPFQITPDLHDVKPPMDCGYIADGYCPKDATWHIFWNRDLDNGAACDEHYEKSKRWVWYTTHRMNDVCAEGGGHLVFLSNGESTCIHDDDGDAVNAAFAAGIELPVDLETGRVLPVEVPV